MNKSVIALTVVIGATVAAAAMLRHELQRERARADALAERVVALEPIERSTASTNDVSARSPIALPPPQDQLVERAQPDETPTIESEPRRPTVPNQGSPHARRQVERLQSALANGTPLQEYQIKLLIEAIDQVRREIANEKASRSGVAAASNADWTKAENDRIVRASYEFLFESQIEAFIELLKREKNAQNSLHE